MQVRMEQNGTQKAGPGSKWAASEETDSCRGARGRPGILQADVEENEETMGNRGANLGPQTTFASLVGDEMGQ